MPSNAVPPVDTTADEPFAQPISLPVTLNNVRVLRSGNSVDASELQVTGESVLWGDSSILGVDIVLHGIMSDEPSCVYAQLESGDDVRFFPAASTDISVLFRALSSVAMIAENAVQAQEEVKDDNVYARRPDGTVGNVVDWDAMLADDTEVMRYEDAEEDMPQKQSNGSTKNR